MDGGSVLLSLAAVLVGVPAVEYAALSNAEPLGLPGVRKVFWCDGKQRMVDVEFMQVNRNKYDVASCTAFSVDDCISCDRHCTSVLRYNPA
jgi:hypothetical protein